MIFFKSKSKGRRFNWWSILAYPVAFIKGVIVGKILNNLRLGKR